MCKAKLYEFQLSLNFWEKIFIAISLYRENIKQNIKLIKVELINVFLQRTYVYMYTSYYLISKYSSIFTINVTALNFFDDNFQLFIGDKQFLFFEMISHVSIFHIHVSRHRKRDIESLDPIIKMKNL